MEPRITRRQLMQTAAVALAGLGDADNGAVAGHPAGAQAGMEMLAAGGNAVDAAVTAALVACVVELPGCGIGGYGGHLVIAPAGRGREPIAIDFNSAAPAAARADMFPLDADGLVRGRVNEQGWLAAGVPGTLAGLQLALDRHGSRSFRQVVQPAIRLARDGFPISPSLASAIRNARPAIERDPGSARLLLSNGTLPRPGRPFRNPELANLLETLAAENRVDAFYRGRIAEQIAAAFQRGGGLVTVDDLAGYRARAVAPLTIDWCGQRIYTVPLTAGGATIVETIGVLRALGWDRCDPTDPRTTHRHVEALRLAWDDRLRHFGDPEQIHVPLDELLSARHARRLAGRVEEAVRRRCPARSQTDGRSAHGTIHISAGDSTGMLVAVTLTHGEYFGARVTVDGLGLILGHGMSRFDPRPDHPNAPGPRKRPLHNMCPTVVYRDGRAVLAVGGRGGRRIPNAVFDVVSSYVARGLSLADAIAAPRLHTEGGMQLTVESRLPAAHVRLLRGIGYKVRIGPSATVHAVEFNCATGECHAGGR
jgi:gamma-glutamyltranspeptidase/glutathione hydrolase